MINENTKWSEKMKKKLCLIVSVVSLLFSLAGCKLFSKDDPKPEEPEVYQIYYFDYGSQGTRQTKEVKLNEFYEISVPVRQGYTFKGYYDQAEDGTQHVNASGQSIHKYNLKDDLVLYGHWQAKTYHISFDALKEKLEVTYDEVPESLPSDVDKEGYTFKGWYQKQNGAGIHYSDQTGKELYTKAFNHQFYEMNDEGVTMYAHYEIKTYPIVFNLGVEASAKQVIVNVNHGEKIEDYFPKDLVNEQGVISWSTRK